MLSLPVDEINPNRVFLGFTRLVIDSPSRGPASPAPCIREYGAARYLCTCTCNREEGLKVVPVDTQE